MHDILRGVTSRLSIGVATAIVTTIVVAGGLAYASQTESVPNNSVTTAKIRNNAVTSAKIRNNTIRTADLHPSVRNQLGVPGPAGPAGPPGPAGAAARFAFVAASAGPVSLIRGSGVTGVGRIGVGIYSVTFASSIAGCGKIATLTDNAGGTVQTGQIGAEETGANTVWVRTTNSAGAPADRLLGDGFTLMVLC